MANKKWELNLNSEAFNAFKTDFQSILNTALNTMLQKERENAEITVKFKVTLEQGYAPDLQQTAYAADREIVIPKFEHKISSVLQIKNEKSGVLGGSDYELVWDKDACCFIMRPIKDAQSSLFDDDEAQNTPPRMLPSGDVIDVDCEPADGEENEEPVTGDLDELISEATSIVRELGQATTSILQRRLKIGYSRAARLMDELEERGVVGSYNGSNPREVYQDTRETDGYEYDEPASEATE